MFPKTRRAVGWLRAETTCWSRRLTCVSSPTAGTEVAATEATAAAVADRWEQVGLCARTQAAATAGRNLL